MIRPCITLLVTGLLAPTLSAFDEGIRLAWDFGSAEAVTAGVYARMAPSGDGNRWLLGYSDGPSIHVRDSSSGGVPPFSAARRVATLSGYDSTNAELTRLANGWLMLGYNARPQSAFQGVQPYQIRTLISRDQGRTWGDEQVPYTAGTTPGVGCWEPIFFQRPSGEVLLFFANEHPYPATAEQEIGLMRSADNGLTWQSYTAASFRSASRDGMPVPLLLADGKTLVFAIEDNGLNGYFKPAIIASTAAADWAGGPVGGNSPQRRSALRADVALPASVYAGAPYLTRLATGETLLSVQSTENRLGTDHTYSAPRVYIGTADARDFARPSTPLPWLPATASANWNSLAVLSEDRVALLSSLRGVASAFGQESIWQIQARVLRPLELPHRPAEIDGAASPGEWTKEATPDAPIFIGGYSKTRLTGNAQWDVTHLYLHFSVQDAQVWADNSSATPTAAWEDDGVECYLDPLNVSTAGLSPNLFKLVVGAAGETRFYQTGGGNTWAPWDAAGSRVRTVVTGTANNNADSDAGYEIELSLPWSALGGRPAEGEGWGIHFRLHDDDDGAAAESHEDMGGNGPDKPATWMRATLRNTTVVLAGAGEVVGTDIRHPNGNHYDQVLLTGATATVRADIDQVTRVSFIDLNDDIVQLEFSGAGALKVSLEQPSGPAAPINYNQAVAYMKGHAVIEITGADSSTNFSLTSVGKLTAYDPTGGYDLAHPASATNDPARNGNPIFRTGVAYDGIADVGLVTIFSRTGAFGGCRCGGGGFFRSAGKAGIDAAGVNFVGPVLLHDLTASDAATPVLLTAEVGSGFDAASGLRDVVRITGGDLSQLNGTRVQIGGLKKLRPIPGTTSHNVALSARAIAGRFSRDGADVTGDVVEPPLASP